MANRVMEKALSPVDWRLLEALERFRLLTIAQGERLGLAQYRHVAERFRRLRTAKLVHVTERPFRMGAPLVFCLSRKGAQALAEWRGDAQLGFFRKEPYPDTMHLPQRVLTVDLHIVLREWAKRIGGAVERATVGFDANPDTFQPATALEHRGVKAEPDLLAAVASADGRRWLLAFEVETGGRAHRLSNFHAHLGERMEALKARVYEHGTGWPRDGDHKAARLVFVFETPAMLAGAMKRVRPDEGEEWGRVLFGVLPTDPDAFNGGWLRADGKEGPLLAIGSP